MVKLTAMKMRRMSLGLRQVDISIGTGLHQSKLSAIENELVEPTGQEREKINAFLSQVQERASRMQPLPA